MRDYKQLNGLALAYVGDAVYEVYIRDYLVAQGQTREPTAPYGDPLCVGQSPSGIDQKMLDEEILTEEEHDFAAAVIVKAIRVQKCRCHDVSYRYWL